MQRIWKPIWGTRSHCWALHTGICWRRRFRAVVWSEDRIPTARLQLDEDATLLRRQKYSSSFYILTFQQRLASFISCITYANIIVGIHLKVGNFHWTEIRSWDEYHDNPQRVDLTFSQWKRRVLTVFNGINNPPRHNTWRNPTPPIAFIRVALSYVLNFVIVPLHISPSRYISERLTSGSLLLWLRGMHCYYSKDMGCAPGCAPGCAITNHHYRAATVRERVEKVLLGEKPTKRALEPENKYAVAKEINFIQS